MIEYAVPDATTWTDDQGNVWTSNGADVTVSEPSSWDGVAFKIEIETSTPGTFLDVTDDYVAAKWWSARRSKWGQSWTPGGASITLKNGDVPGFAYSGTEWFGSNTSAKVRIGRAVRIWSLHDPDHPQILFVGYVAGPTSTVKPGPPNLTTIQVETALSRIANARRDAVTAVGAGDTEVERFDRILDSAGWSSTLRRYETSGTLATCVPNTTLEGPALDELSLVSASFLCEILEDVFTGSIRYVAQASVARSLGSPVRLFVREIDDYVGLPYPYVTPTEWTWEMSKANVINYASTAEVGGTPTVKENADSQDAYGLATYIRDDLICNAGYAPLPATYWVYHFAEPIEYPTRILFTGGTLDVVDALLSMEPLHHIQVSLPDLVTLMDIQVVGVEHSIRPGRGDSHPEGRGDVWSCVLLTDRTQFTGTNPDE